MNELTYSNTFRKCSCGEMVKSCKETGIGITIHGEDKIEWFNCACKSTLVHITKGFIKSSQEPSQAMILKQLTAEKSDERIRI